MEKLTLKKNILDQSEVRSGWSISLWRDGNLQSLCFRWQSSAGHISCYVCGFSTWNWGIFIQKRCLTWGKGHCIWVFSTKETSLGKCCLQAPWFHCWLAPALSAPCHYSFCISLCWLFTSHLCAQHNLQTPWKGNPTNEKCLCRGLMSFVLRLWNLRS